MAAGHSFDARALGSVPWRLRISWEEINGRGLPALVLQQYACLPIGRVGRDLRPIQFQEFIGKRIERNIKGLGGVTAEFNRQLRYRKQQRKLVSGDELSFFEQPLDMVKESELFIRGRNRRSSHLRLQ
jgi:hypothetical protein